MTQHRRKSAASSAAFRRLYCRRRQRQAPRPRNGIRPPSHRRIVLGKHFALTSSDNFKLGAYRADPAGTAKGGIVVIQEIFGVNHHIRAVCDRLAGEGYAALAPAVFDRQQPNFECGYTPDEIANARKFVANPDWGAMLRDVQAVDRRTQERRPGRDHGFLHGRHDFVSRGLQAQRTVGGRVLLRRPDRQERRRRSRKCRCRCISARRTPRSR